MKKQEAKPPFPLPPNLKPGDKFVTKVRMCFNPYNALNPEAWAPGTVITYLGLSRPLKRNHLAARITWIRWPRFMFPGDNCKSRQVYNLADIAPVL